MIMVIDFSYMSTFKSTLHLTCRYHDIYKLVLDMELCYNAMYNYSMCYNVIMNMEWNTWISDNDIYNDTLQDAIPMKIHCVGHTLTTYSVGLCMPRSRENNTFTLIKYKYIYI